MCQTDIVSNNIIRLSRRCFNQRLGLPVVKPQSITQKIKRLNSDVSALVNHLFEIFESITAADYRVFGPQLRLLIETLQSLKADYSRQHVLVSNSEVMTTLSSNISNLIEIDNDIENFKVRLPHSKRMATFGVRLAAE